MGSNPSGREAEEMRKHLPAQRARRKTPKRLPAKQADPDGPPKIVKTVNFGWPSFFLLTFHGVEPERARPLRSSLPWGSVKPSVPSFLSFFSSAFTRRSSFLYPRQAAGSRTIPAVDEAATHTLALFSAMLLLDLVQTVQVVFLGVEGRHRVRKVLCFDEDIG